MVLRISDGGRVGSQISGVSKERQICRRRQGVGCSPELAVITPVDAMPFQFFELDMVAWTDRSPLEGIVPSPVRLGLIEVRCRELLLAGEEIRVAIRLPATIGLVYRLRRFGCGPVKCAGWAC